MPLPRLVLRRMAFAALLAACGRDLPPRSADSASAPLPAGPGADRPAAAPPTWIAALGPVLLVAGDTGSEALIVPPDSAMSDEELGLANLPGRTVHLFDRAGAAGTATILARQPEEPGFDCLGRPVLHLDHAPAGKAWTLGLLGEGLAPIAFDSIAGHASRDSAATAAAVARLASTLPPGDTAFSGLPFAVVDARRFRIGDRAALVAYVVRRVNREASPLQERTLLVAEAAEGQPLVVRWHERSAGHEEEVEANELLAGFTDAAGVTYLIVARDASSGVSWSLLERDGTGRWRVRWTGSGGVC